MATKPHNQFSGQQNITASQQRLSTINADTSANPSLSPLAQGTLPSNKVKGAIADGGISAGNISQTSNYALQQQGPDFYSGFNSQIFGDPPKAELGKVSGVGNVLQFPPGGADFYINFTFLKYDRSDVKSGAKTKIGKAISLPLPNNLVDNYNMNLAEKSAASVFGFNLGVVENSGADIISSIAGMSSTDMGKAAGEGLQNLSKTNVPNALKSGVETALRNSDYIGRMAAGMVDILPGVSNAASFYERIFGKTLNPFQAMQFEGIQLRSHTFSFRLVPTDEKESATIKEIVKEFKQRMHPTLSSSKLLFNYPDVVEIAFKPKTLYKINPCFIESVSVNYAPTGAPTFYAGTQEPIEVDISINLKEIRPVTREDLED